MQNVFNVAMNTCQTQLDPAQWPDIHGKSDTGAACEKIETRTALRVDILLSKCAKNVKQISIWIKFILIWTVNKQKNVQY